MKRPNILALDFTTFVDLLRAKNNKVPTPPPTPHKAPQDTGIHNVTLSPESLSPFFFLPFFLILSHSSNLPT